MSKCEICGKDGFHKLSCTNNTELKKYYASITKQIEEGLIPWEYEPMTSSMENIFTAFIPTLEGEEAEEFIRKADENVKAMRQRRCKNHVWRKDYLNGGKVCQVCGKAKEEPVRNKDVEP